MSRTPYNVLNQQRDGKQVVESDGPLANNATWTIDAEVGNLDPQVQVSYLEQPVENEVRVVTHDVSGDYAVEDPTKFDATAGGLVKVGNFTSATPYWIVPKEDLSGYATFNKVATIKEVPNFSITKAVGDDVLCLPIEHSIDYGSPTAHKDRMSQVSASSTINTIFHKTSDLDPLSDTFDQLAFIPLTTMVGRLIVYTANPSATTTVSGVVIVLDIPAYSFDNTKINYVNLPNIVSLGSYKIGLYSESALKTVIPPANMQKNYSTSDTPLDVSSGSCTTTNITNALQYFAVRSAKIPLTKVSFYNSALSQWVKTTVEPSFVTASPFGAYTAPYTPGTTLTRVNELASGTTTGTKSRLWFKCLSGGVNNLVVYKSTGVVGSEALGIEVLVDITAFTYKVGINYIDIPDTLFNATEYVAIFTGSITIACTGTTSGGQYVTLSTTKPVITLDKITGLNAGAYDMAFGFVDEVPTILPSIKTLYTANTAVINQNTYSNLYAVGAPNELTNDLFYGRLNHPEISESDIGFAYGLKSDGDTDPTTITDVSFDMWGRAERKKLATGSEVEIKTYDNSTQIDIKNISGGSLTGLKAVIT